MRGDESCLSEIVCSLWIAGRYCIHEYSVVGSPMSLVPKFVLRNHESPVTTVRFLSENRQLSESMDSEDIAMISSDSDGNMKFWSLSIRRPVLEWNTKQTNVTSVVQLVDDKVARYFKIIQK